MGGAMEAAVMVVAQHILFKTMGGLQETTTHHKSHQTQALLRIKLNVCNRIKPHQPRVLALLRGHFLL
jgi:hypothetical protein